MDKRIIKSEKALKETFVKLMRTKEPAEITVRELCRDAGLNRSTFYERFGYMDALIEAILSDCINDVCFGQDPINSLPREDGGVSKAEISRYVDSFLSNKTLMKFCTCESSDRYRALIIQLQVRISMTDADGPVEYFPGYFQNAGVVQTLMEWVHTRMPIPKDAVVEIIHQFSKAMYQ